MNKIDDTISRQAAIDALKNDMASLDHIIKGMSTNDVRLDAYVSQRNQVNYDIYTINNLPPALGTNLAEVGTDCISRQAAICALSTITMYKGSIPYNTAVMRIEQLPPANNSEIPNSSDTISRQQAIDICRAPHMRNADCSDFEMAIMMLPPAQPERIRGRWTRDNACSECGCQPWFSGDIHNYNFCPHCGADMRGELK